MKLKLPPKRLDLHGLAFNAAEEIETGLRSQSTDPGSSARALADELCQMFPANKEPSNLPPATIGLVCSVVGGWKEDANLAGYEQFCQTARKIAALLVQPGLSANQAQKLLRFCDSLFFATQSNPAVHSVSDDLPNVLRMG
jgi:hypothetical protein